MNLFSSIILGIIEGLTEFLPISSTGHMIIAQPLLGVPDSDQWQVFLIVSQIGAILAVVVYFWRDLWRRVFHPPSVVWERHILVKLIIAVAPALILGKLFNDFLEQHLEKPLPVALALIIGAGGIEYIDRRFRRQGIGQLEDVTLRQSFLVGLAQCVAMWPGVSRAAATIMGGMVVGLTPAVATEFSFYLAIPTMFAAGGYRLIKHHDKLTGASLSIILAGTTVAFLVALAVVAGFMSYVRRRRFAPFSIYRLLLGLLVLYVLFATDLLN